MESSENDGSKVSKNSATASDGNDDAGIANDIAVTLENDAENKLEIGGAASEVACDGRPEGRMKFGEEVNKIEIDSTIGNNHLAIGNYDRAIGSNVISIGSNALTIGSNDLSIGNNDLAVGTNELIFNDNDLAIGYDVDVEGVSMSKSQTAITTATAKYSKNDQMALSAINDYNKALTGGVNNVFIGKTQGRSSLYLLPF